MVEPDFLAVFDDVAFCHRVASYLDGSLAAADFRTFNAELEADRGKRAAFVRICLVRSALIRRGTVSRDVAELYGRAAAQLSGVVPAGDVGPSFDAGEEFPPAVPAAAALSLDDAMILPAVHEVADEVQAGLRVDDIGPPAGQGGRPASDTRARRWYVAAAAVVAVGVGLTFALRSAPPAPVPVAVQPPATRVTPPIVRAEPAPATITAVAAAVGGDGPDPIRPRTELASGATLRLSAGAVELTFAGGATVVVRAPAQIAVTDRNALAVAAGAVYAHVPPEAIGFRVTAPGLDVVDRGTNFGVRTGPREASAEVHVFDGRVDATGVDGGGRPTGQASPVTAGNAAGHGRDAADPNVAVVPFVAAAFDRDITRVRMPVPAHGTGAGLADGAVDPAWQLVAGPPGPTWRPGPVAVVFDPRPEYAANSPAAKWVSTSARMANADGGRYTYRTTLDLTGFDPASVAVRASFAADDGVAEILVNGQAADVPADLTRDLDADASRTAVHRVTLSDARWQAGPNQVDVVVVNSPQVGLNYTGLQLGWDVTASPVVRR